jgi:hypothetical protein
VVSYSDSQLFAFICCGKYKITTRQHQPEHKNNNTISQASTISLSVLSLHTTCFHCSQDEQPTFASTTPRIRTGLYSLRTSAGHGSGGARVQMVLQLFTIVKSLLCWVEGTLVRLRATNCGMHCIHRTNPL